MGNIGKGNEARCIPKFNKWFRTEQAKATNGWTQIIKNNWKSYKEGSADTAMKNEAHDPLETCLEKKTQLVQDVKQSSVF